MIWNMAFMEYETRGCFSCIKTQTEIKVDEVLKYIILEEMRQYEKEVEYFLLLNKRE